MEITMYDTLLQLPLFQGLGKTDFTTILEKVKFYFSKHKTKETIIKSGQRCEELVFLLKGSMQSEVVSPNRSFTLYETIQAPFLIEPYSLFGRLTEYKSTYTIKTEANLISIKKSYLLNELHNYEIIRLNMHNMISNRAQTLYDKLWQIPEQTIEKRIIQFVNQHCDLPSGEKELKIKMKDFAPLLETTRIRLSKALNNMQQLGLLKLHRGGIYIPELTKLNSQ